MRETHNSSRFVSGTKWRECAICGFDYLEAEMTKNYKNQWVCPKDYEDEHPNRVSKQHGHK